MIIYINFVVLCCTGLCGYTQCWITVEYVVSIIFTSVNVCWYVLFIFLFWLDMHSSSGAVVVEMIYLTEWSSISGLKLVLC